MPVTVAAYFQMRTVFFRSRTTRRTLSFNYIQVTDILVWLCFIHDYIVLSIISAHPR
jgi:hypothetical protein